MVAAGLWPATGVDSNRFVRGALAPLRPLQARHRLIVFNRRRGLPAGVSISDLAAEYAEAINQSAIGPSISSERRPVEASSSNSPPNTRTRCGDSSSSVPPADSNQGAAALEPNRRAPSRGPDASALGLVGASLAPHGFRTLARSLAWAAANRLIEDPVGAADLAATLEAEESFDLRGCEQPIQATTLIVAGGRDRFYNHELFAETAALIPNSQLRLFPRRGHITVATDRRAQATIAGFLNPP